MADAGQLGEFANASSLGNDFVNGHVDIVGISYSECQPELLGRPTHGFMRRAMVAGMANETLGQRLSRLRADKSVDEKRSVTQDEVADAVGIGRSTLGTIEADHDVPGLATARALADYYGVSLDWLVTGEGYPQPTALQERTARLASLFDALPPSEQEIVETLAQSLSRLPRN
jgi:transcriptional regulator with XRE-family HTH domain